MGIICILFFSFLLRLANLAQSLWLDEAVQAVTAQQPFNYIFQEIRGDFHPPLYHFLIYGWTRLFGFSEISLRLPSVLFGVATIYLVYLIAKEILVKKNFSFPEATALLLATAPFHIYYSQETRMYAMATFFACLSMYFFMKLVLSAEMGERRKKLQTPDFKLLTLSYILFTTLLLYSDYYGFLILLAQAMAVLLVKRKKFLGFLVLQFFCLFLFLPWLPMLWVQIQNGLQATQLLPGWGRLVNVNFFKALPLTFVKFSLGRITIFNRKLYALIVGVLFVIYGGIIFRGFFKGKKLSIIHYPLSIACWFFLPLLSAWLLSLFIPNYQPFRLLLVLPAFYLLLAYGASRFHATIVYIIVVAILGVNLASTAVYYFNPYFHREDWRGVVQYIESQEKAVAILPSDVSNWPWRYYSSGKAELITVSPGVKEVEQKDLSNRNIGKLENWKIYYIRYLVPLFDPQERIIAWLRENDFVKIKGVSFNQIPVWVYERGERS